MHAATATTALLVALAAVALAPAASADVTVDVEDAADCESPAVGTGPAFRDRIYTEDCDVHAEKENPYVACRTGAFGTGPALEPRVWTDGECDLHVAA